jgi:hypothetical protein
MARYLIWFRGELVWLRIYYFSLAVFTYFSLVTIKQTMWLQKMFSSHVNGTCEQLTINWILFHCTCSRQIRAHQIIILTSSFHVHCQWRHLYSRQRSKWFNCRFSITSLEVVTHTTNSRICWHHFHLTSALSTSTLEFCRQSHESNVDTKHKQQHTKSKL